MSPEFHGCVVLVVDPAAAIRKIARFVLEREGHCVLEAPDGVQALQLLGTYNGLLDLVMCGTAMPRMNAAELITTLRKGQPDLKVLLMPDQTSNLAIENVEVIQKPFGVRALAQTLHRLIDSGKPPVTPQRPIAA